MAKDILVTAYSYINAVLEAAMPDILRREQELFGDAESITDEEFEIIFSDLTHHEKLAALAAVRGRKGCN